MKAIAFALFLVATGAATAGCGSSTMRVGALDEVERVRDTSAIKDAAAGAPEVFARAEQERAYARAAHAQGDDVGASLHAERAMAAYGHAQAVARLARAIADLADSQKAVDDATSEEGSLAASRAKLELDAQELERRAVVMRERLLPAASREVSDARDAARATSANSLAMEARLLCEAARLLFANATGLVEAQGDLDKLEAKLSLPEPRRRMAPGDRLAIDDAGAVRARCLDVLTGARRATAEGDGRADGLLAELSAVGGWDPTRDERGIVVTVRGAFVGTKLTGEGETRFETLGRVAATHPTFALQVVVHDAMAPTIKDESDAQRADAAAKALIAGGASTAHLKTELAGAHTPVVDPNDEHLRARNERVDVVFVSGG